MNATVVANFSFFSLVSWIDTCNEEERGDEEERNSFFQLNIFFRKKEEEEKEGTGVEKWTERNNCEKETKERNSFFVAARYILS